MMGPVFSKSPIFPATGTSKSHSGPPEGDMMVSHAESYIVIYEISPSFAPWSW